MSQTHTASSTSLYTNPLSRLQTNATDNTDVDMDSTSIYSEKAALLYPSKDGSQPGFAPEQTLSRGLQVPSKSSRLTSGFEYPSVLAQYDVSEQDWTQFTQEITANAKLSPAQWSTVIGSGIGAMAIGGMMIGFFSAIPAIFVAKRVRAKEENRNLAAAMGISLDNKGGEQAQEQQQEQNVTALSQRINYWNETFFQPRGLLIRIDMPFDTSAVEDKLDVPISSKNPSPSSSRQGSVTSIEIQQKNQRRARYEAQERARVVIIPLNGHAESILSQATTLASESPYIPAVYE